MSLALLVTGLECWETFPTVLWLESTNFPTLDEALYHAPMAHTWSAGGPAGRPLMPADYKGDPSAVHPMVSVVIL